jgi:para-aminobenzoate synthetase / 4-amino-4-deoxychorismate lyase
MNDCLLPPDSAQITALIDFADPAILQGAATSSGATTERSLTNTALRYAFGAPRQHLVAHTAAQVQGVFDAVQALAQQGAWCVGYVRYEAASAWDAALLTHPAHSAGGPLVWFAVYEQPLPWPDNAAWPQLVGGAWAWSSTLQRGQFDASLAQIQAGIAAGDYYQVNYTAPLIGQWHAASSSVANDACSTGGTTSITLDQNHQAALALFAALQRAQPGGYAAYIRAEDAQGESVLSVSPELFFDWRIANTGAGKSGTLLARPMKGTAPRGATPAQDAVAEHTLRQSPKERAENVMIVDLLRNDMSRIAEPHSVQVPKLFATQALPAVWQMTSDVEARTRPGTTLAQVFGALFPCGSVTGAPKAQAMRAIAALEPQARGVYCGALGVVHPTTDGIRAVFNVPIRTVVLSHGGSKQTAPAARCSIGSGITADAQPNAEWAEWAHKKSFLDRASQPFDVLETLALQDGQYRNRQLHVARMAQTAAHFGVPWQQHKVDACLAALASQYPAGQWRVRLLMAANGVPHAQAFALLPTPSPVNLQWAQQPLLQAQGEFVRFKTTHRAHYDAFTPSNADVFDTILFNPAGEITECTRGNIAMQINGKWVTPALACGLLPGVGRAVALQKGEVTEAVVNLGSAHLVQAWAFINSLRGWLPAQVVGDAPASPNH